MLPDRVRRLFPDAVLIASVAVWMTLILLAPYLRQHDLIWAEPLYSFFNRICHQIPERSFVVWGLRIFVLVAAVF